MPSQNKPMFTSWYSWANYQKLKQAKWKIGKN